MNRRNFLKLSETLLANIICFPLIRNRKVNEWFIAVDGGAWNVATGTINDPFSFDGLRQDPLGLVQPGDKIYLREGYYTTTTPMTQTKWNGTKENPILIKPYKNEEVIIDGCVDLFGGYQHWDGFEMLNTRWITRESQQTGSNPTDIGEAWEAFNIDCTGVTISNCDIHDCRQGIRSIGDNELTVENCRIWNNGWNAPDRGHGHGIYWNGNGCMIRKNWIGKGYSEWGVCVYGNISDNVLCENNDLEECMILISTTKNAIVRNNTITMRIEDDTRFADYDPISGDNIEWDHNIYRDYRNGAYNFTYGMTFSQWKETFGFDFHSQYLITEANRKQKVLDKLYPGVYELNQELGDSVVRLPPAPYAVWLKDVEES